ncbi:sulfur carrier protein ThiS [Maritimibacter sp. DP07]|jgi:sulfur carrier protein|uniref:Sulfur carrier protein ThiS n=1 Tax=Maritimibacter harenae TaxID=2606218 RepID=A0A845M5P7_9RHOB|nr:sulfur carrier protein ThiS [Maritimibacter harenae]MZR13758.1 sulfur carrier protein ThiS [Maritimibacter harenae]
MNITLNGTLQDIAGPTLEDLLRETGQAGAKVATAVNETFVPAGQRADLVLQPGDRVEIVAPRQGG